MSETGEFARAVEEFTAQPRATKPVETMMQLACEAKSATLRKWAAEWLFQHFNILVVDDQIIGGEDATATKATDLR